VQAILRNQDIYKGIDQYAKSAQVTQRAAAVTSPPSAATKPQGGPSMAQ